MTPAVIEVLGTHGMDVWVYRGADWFIRDPQGPHVARETRTVLGNASHEVQEAARRVTTSNEDEGFANAVERFILA